MLLKVSQSRRKTCLSRKLEGLRPIYDIRTRWNSIYPMVARFNSIMSNLKYLYVDTKLDWPLNHTPLNHTQISNVDNKLFFNGKLLKKIFNNHILVLITVNFGNKVFKVNLIKLYQRDEHKDILISNLRKIARSDPSLATAESYAAVPSKNKGPIVSAVMDFLLKVKEEDSNPTMSNFFLASRAVCD